MKTKSHETTKPTRKLAWTFAGLLLLIGVLQIVSLLAVLEINAIRAQSRLQVDVAFAQHPLTEEYENRTYLALVGLSTADWEMLVRQRNEAVELGKEFKASIDALLRGGAARLGDAEVELTRVDDPEIRTALAAASASWDEMVAAHVRILRSDNRSLKANVDLENFQRVEDRLSTDLRNIAGRLQRHSGAKIHRLDLVQHSIPIGAILLSALMGLFVFQRIILPFGGSMEDLRKSEGELRAARDDLERRVEERTAELARTNDELRAARDDLERRVEERTAELARTNDELRRQTEILDSMLQNMGDGVLVSDVKGRFVLRNAMASQLLGLDHGDLDIERWRGANACFMADGTTRFPEDEMPLLRAVRGEATEQVEIFIQSLDRPKGLWLSVTGRPLYDHDEILRGSVMVFRDVTLRKQAEEALRRAHDELEIRVKERTEELRDAQRRSIDLARQAGMAELATNMLHNVGNVLNSLNTSTTILGERLRALRVDTLSRMSSVLEEHRSDLVSFLTTDDRGRRLPDLLGKLNERMITDREEMLGMVDALHRHVEHIRSIVELQQSYATSSNFMEVISLEELVEDALRISAAALGRHHIKCERHIEKLPRLLVDKHRVLQILLNLVSNAKYALDKNAGDRRMTLRIERTTDDRIRIEVRDNGMGISPELLTKIFQHGFTTRKEGHGFGLHSCAIAARAMGGSLEVHSDGVGRGATFMLLFPYRPEVPGGT
jgi:PAS domain S-box-containing protein